MTTETTEEDAKTQVEWLILVCLVSTLPISLSPHVTGLGGV